MTSLHTAVEKENIEIVRLLLSNEKININLQNIFEKKYFLFIKFQKKLFFQFNSSLNLLIKFTKYIHKTALHIAVEKGNLDIIKLLLQRKEIDTSIRDAIITKYFNQISKQILMILSLILCKKTVEYTENKEIIQLFKE